jgi:hypothetical protein
MLTRFLVVLVALLVSLGVVFGQELSPQLLLGSPTFYSSRGDFIPEDVITLPRSVSLRSFQNLRFGDLAQALRNLDGALSSGEYLIRFSQSQGTQTPQVVWVQVHLGEQPRILGIRNEFLETTTNRVIKTEDFTPLGVRTHETFFFFSRNGQLVAIEQVGSSGITTSQSFSWNQNRLVEERFHQGNRLELRIFDLTGQMIREERFIDQILREEITYQYVKNRLNQRIRRMFNESGSEVGRQEVLVDTLGRDLVIRDYQGQGLLKVQELSYLEETQLITERRIETHSSQGSQSTGTRPGEFRIIQYRYSDEQELISEVTLVNQVLVQSIEFYGSRRIQSFYQRGQVVLRITYDDEVRVLEEDIQAGRVVRTRVLPQRITPGVQP